MKKEEKIELKRSLSQLKDSIFPEQWEEIVGNYPFIQMNDEDIEDDLEFVQEESLVEIGRRDYEQKMDQLKNSFGEAASLMGGLGRTKVEVTDGARKGKETGLWFSNVCEVYVVQHGYDVNMCFPNSEAQAEYLISIGYKRLFDCLKNNNQ